MQRGRAGGGSAPLALLISLLPVCRGAFNDTRFYRLPYVQQLFDDASCLSHAGVCSSRTTGPSGADRQTIAGLDARGRGAAPSLSCDFCSHGAHMLPLLIQRYHVRSLAEIGVCSTSQRPN